MRMSLPIGGALLALAAFASAAEARMTGSGMAMSSSMSHGGGNATTSSSMGSPRNFSPDGLQTRVKGSNWKRPTDSNGGMLGDPPIKPPKASTQPRDEGGYIDQYGNYHHGRYNGGGNASSSGPPLACVGRIGDC